MENKLKLVKVNYYKQPIDSKDYKLIGFTEFFFNEDSGHSVAAKCFLHAPNPECKMATRLEIEVK